MSGDRECRELPCKQTLGEYRVGSTFNPSGDDAVTRLKAKAAAFIDECESQMHCMSERVDRYDGSYEERAQMMESEELFDRAMRECESAAMFAVKAATKRPRA